jgi:uncharacterized protein YbaP (TraB family)
MSLLKRFGRRLAAISAVAATACGAAPAAEPVAAKPALWKVADKDTTIYLFGTVHLLPKGTRWRSPAFDHAVAASDTLVVETIVDEKNPEPVRDALRTLAVSPNLPPIVDRVSPEKRAALMDVIRISGIPIEIYDKFETWADGYLLLLTQLGRLGLDPGVESAIKTQFTDAGKPIGQLETVTEQLGFFDSLPEEAQRKFVEEVLEDPAAMKKELDGMVSAWSSGDVKAISRTFNDELKGSQDLKTNLLVRRNANWAKWVKGRLDQPGTVLVAVGAGHLAGDQSVQTMLEQQGVNVTRVQ